MFKLTLASLALAAIPCFSPSGVVPTNVPAAAEVSVSTGDLLALPPPSAPVGFAAFRISTTPAADPICCVWSYSGPAVSGFRIARLDPGENPNNPAHWDNISGNLTAGTRAFLDCTALCPGQTYRYKVRAYVNTPNGVVYSPYSNVAAANP